VKHPSEPDFQVTAAPDDGFVKVVFVPTNSNYMFTLVQPRERQVHGPLSPAYQVRHGQTGDTGAYDGDEIIVMARLLAERAIGKGKP
jgi:hypothetical protein